MESPNELLLRLEDLYGQSLDPLIGDHSTSFFEANEPVVNSTSESFGITESPSRPTQEISRFTGDDIHKTTNDPRFAIIGNLYVEDVLEIKLSKHDLHYSRYIGIYTEEWLFLPPSIWSSYDAAVLFGRSTHLPAVLDTVKLKNLSPIRKQTSLEFDLSSKFHSLSAAANWTNPHWLTYPMHQVSQILGTTIFDFSDEIEFPFLHKKDGGSGGNPPWNQADTSTAYLHYFNRGKSSITLKGVMSESVAISKGELSPIDSLYLRFSHLAASGLKIWEHQISNLLEAKKIYSDEEIRRFLDLEPLAPDMITLIREFENNPYNRAVISALYDRGIVSTELDAKLRLLSLERNEDMRKQIPYSTTLNYKEERKIAIKRKSLKIFDNIISKKESKYEGPFPDLYENTVKDYIEFNLNQYGVKAKFLSEPTLRVLLTEDLERVLLQKGLQQLISSMKDNVIYIFNVEGSLAQDIARFSEWFKSTSNLENPPDGLISDDIRISYEVKHLHNRDIGIITDDIQLFKSLGFQRGSNRLTRISVGDYIDSIVNNYLQDNVLWRNFRTGELQPVPLKYCHKYRLTVNTVFLYDVANMFRRAPMFKVINKKLIPLPLPGWLVEDVNYSPVFWTRLVSSVRREALADA